jgi:hypothetical protein
VNRTRSAFAVLALVALSLPVLMGASAATDAPEGVGDASAGLVGAHLAVEDLDGLTAGVLGGVLGDLDALGVLDTSIDLGLLEGLTAATTRETPDARALLSPLRIGDDRPLDVSAGPGESAGSDAVAPDPLSALVSGLGVSAFEVSADADDDHAIATIEAVEATLDALGTAGMDIGLTGVVSEVTRTGASAEQDLMVEGLAIGLGDILPAELLESLPLDALLDLIEELGAAGLLEGVDGLRDALESAVAEATTSINAVNAFELDDIDEDLIDELAAVLELLGELEDIDDLGGLVEDILQLGLGLLDGTSEEGELLAIISLLEDADELDGVDIDEDCLGTIDEALLDGIEDCVASAIEQLEALVDDLLVAIVADTGLGDLLALLEDLLDDLLAIDGLVDTILGLIDDIAAIDLLAADRLGLEVLASADGEGGSTTIACELGGLEVLGEVIGDTACTEGSLGGGVTGAVGDAFDVLGSVLESLPGVAEVGELRLDLLPVATEDVSTDEDGTVSARAHAVLLELVVPSVTIDPSGVDDILALPELDVLGDLTDLVDDLLAETGLDDLLPEADLTELTAVLDGLVSEIEGVLGTVTDLIGDLDLDVLGISISTPSITLVLDPVSQATFTPASADEPADPGDDPTPTTDTPELPRTGGGIALLGLLAMLGALGLRRTG